jgi:hypothetical protein
MQWNGWILTAIKWQLGDTVLYKRVKFGYNVRATMPSFE